MNVPNRQIRANFSSNTIRVYQAYSSAIADIAVERQRFAPPFKIDRMTWIKPSFCWMMYRSGWATKPGQERILAIDISRTGFNWALRNSCLSHYEADIHESRLHWHELKRISPVRVQWDPERDVNAQKLEHRSIQVGLSGEAVERYVRDWIQRITDVTELAQEIFSLAPQMRDIQRGRIVPTESPYPLCHDVSFLLGMLTANGR